MMTIIKPIQTVITLSFLITFVTACALPQILPNREPEPPAQPAEPPKPANFQAQQLEQQGNYFGAAQEYLRIAQTAPVPARQNYELAAVRNYLKARQPNEAKALLAQIQIPAGFNLHNSLELTHIRLAIVENRFEEAALRLDRFDAASLTMPLRIEYHELRLAVLESRGDALGIVKERVQYERLLGQNQQAIKRNHEQIWRTLALPSTHDLRQVPRTIGDTYVGWVVLSLYARTAHPNRLQQALDSWRVRYPGHPATRHIVPTILTSTQAIPLDSQRIAVLLPLSGRFSAQAKAIQDGITAALLSEVGQQPQMEVYDVNAQNVAQQYEQAIFEGANYVIGPLEKSTITTLLNARASLPVPTLTLNYVVGNPNKTNLFQFGLSPENEAQQVAKRAWRDGHRVAGVLVPQGSWSDRIIEAFQAEWLTQGGQISSVQTYGKDLATPVRAVLKGAGGRPDMVFMVAYPTQARQLKPHFNYHYSETLPIYCTSHVYTGTPLPARDKDLNGIIFGDMPWVLTPDGQATQLLATLQQFQGTDVVRFKRLYALGFDAYHTLPRLQQFSMMSYVQWQGQTGVLNLNNQHLVTRELSWAQFVNGMPQILETPTSVRPELMVLR